MSLASLPTYLPWLVAAVVIGAIAGTSLSLAKLDKRGVLRALGVVLGIAALALVT